MKPSPHAALTQFDELLGHYLLLGSSTALHLNDGFILQHTPCSLLAPGLSPLSPRSHDASWMYFCVSAGLLWLAPPPEPQPQKPALPLGWPPFSQDSENVQLSVPWRAKIREGLLLLTRDTAGQNTQVDPGTRFFGVLLSKSVPE